MGIHGITHVFLARSAIVWCFFCVACYRTCWLKNVTEFVLYVEKVLSEWQSPSSK